MGRSRRPRGQVIATRAAADGVDAAGGDAVDVGEQLAEGLLLLAGEAAVGPGHAGDQHHHDGDVADEDALVLGQGLAQLLDEAVEVGVLVPLLETEPGEKTHGGAPYQILVGM